MHLSFSYLPSHMYGGIWQVLRTVFTPEHAVNSGKNLFLHERIRCRFGLLLGYSCLYSFTLAVSTTYGCCWASLWDNSAFWGTFSSSPVKTDPLHTFVNYYLSGLKPTEVSFCYPGNLTKFEHMTMKAEYYLCLLKEMTPVNELVLVQKVQL